MDRLDGAEAGLSGLVAPRHQRADGALELGLAAAPAGARIVHLHQAAPLRALLPEPEPGDPSLIVTLNVGGGLAGGDSLRVALRAGSGAAATLTNASAEKVYRALDVPAQVASALAVGAGATIEWLPQETILFDGARLERSLDVTLAQGARLLASEMVVFGRRAAGERWRRGGLRDAWRVRQAGRLLWTDRLDVTPAALADRFAFAGAEALATILLAAPDAAARRERLRDLTGGGASLVAPGLLLGRLLGEAGSVRERLAAAIAALRADAFARPPRLPRLWAV